MSGRGIEKDFFEAREKTGLHFTANTVGDA